MAGLIVRVTQFQSQGQNESPADLPSEHSGVGGRQGWQQQLQLGRHRQLRPYDQTASEESQSQDRLRRETQSDQVHQGMLSWS